MSFAGPIEGAPVRRGPCLSGEAFRQELLERMDGQLGATLGILAGAVGKAVLSLLMTLIFTVDVLIRSWQ